MSKKAEIMKAVERAKDKHGLYTCPHETELYIGLSDLEAILDKHLPEPKNKKLLKPAASASSTQPIPRKFGECVLPLSCSCVKCWEAKNLPEPVQTDDEKLKAENKALKQIKKMATYNPH